MPGFIARKLCPELIFVPTDFKKYNYYSDLTKKGLDSAPEKIEAANFGYHLPYINFQHVSLSVFSIYDHNFIATSLDEAYLDITEVCKARGITSAEVSCKCCFIET